MSALPACVDEPIWLIRNLSALTDAARGLEGPDACAAVRDLGMLVGALQRLQIAPAAVVPGLEEVLGGLRPGGPPRDTILHYTVANPDGPRMRCFTRAPEERVLIQAVRSAAASAHQAARLLGSLASVAPADPIFAPLCRNVDAHLSSLVDSVSQARDTVSPAFFAQQMRLFFEPVRLDGAMWEGPGAVQLPVWLIDHLLWQAGDADTALRAYRDERLRYSPALAPLVALGHTQGALLERVIQSQDQDAMASIDTMLTTLLRFRMPHATKDGNARSADGSAHGGSLGEATLAARERLRAAMARPQALAL